MPTSSLPRPSVSYHQSQEILTHYITLALQAADVRLDSDVRNEIDSILLEPFQELLEYIGKLEERISSLERRAESER